MAPADEALTALGGLNVVLAKGGGQGDMVSLQNINQNLITKITLLGTHLYKGQPPFSFGSTPSLYRWLVATCHHQLTIEQNQENASYKHDPFCIFMVCHPMAKSPCDIITATKRKVSL